VNEGFLDLVKRWRCAPKSWGVNVRCAGIWWDEVGQIWAAIWGNLGKIGIAKKTDFLKFRM
jgi:hypothetical protein